MPKRKSRKGKSDAAKKRRQTQSSRSPCAVRCQDTPTEAEQTPGDIGAIMCHAAKRLERLYELTTLLEQGEDQKFFDLLFPTPEEYESATNRPAIEEILLSSKLRKLLVRFARQGDVQLANKAAGIIYENFEILRRLAETERNNFGGVTTMHFLNSSKNSKKLKRLFDQMRQARLAAVATLPPPKEEPKVEAA